MSPRSHTVTALKPEPSAPKSNRAIWKGIITAGMMNIPVRLLAATDDRTVSFTQVHADCGSRLKQRLFCPIHNAEVPSDQIQKAYQVSKDVFVRVPEAEIDSLERPSAHTIELKQVVSAGEIDLSLHEKTYYLEPDAVGGRAFNLLALSLAKKKRVGVGRIMIRTRERVCVIRPQNGGLVLDTLLYPDEVRPQPSAQPMLVPSKAELDLAGQWVDAFTSPFEPASYRDEYREAVLDIVSKTVATATPQASPSVPHPAAPDLMAQLKASLEQAKAAKEAAAAPAPEPKAKRVRKPKADKPTE
jgi:DNA end-binding protein Ku